MPRFAKGWGMPRRLLNRTLSVRTATSLTSFGSANGGPGSLSALLRTLHREFETIPQRRVVADGLVIEARNVDDRDRRRPNLIHLVGYTPNDTVPAVPRARNVSHADLTLVEAPENTEFLDGQFMALVDGDDVVMCRDGLGEASFISYVLGLAEAANLDTAELSFSLMKRADVDKLEMIRREGIQSISMNTIAHDASISNIERLADRRSLRERIAGGALGELKAILGIGEDVPPDAENLKVEVLFSFDKRGGTELDKRQLSELAERMIGEEQDGFAIKTLQGRTVRADDIVISKPVRVPAFGKSVHHSNIWDELKTFYTEISEA